MAEVSDVPSEFALRTAATAGQVNGLRRLLRRRSTIAFLMTLPLILVIVGLVAWPSVYSIYLSMLNKKMTAFVGIDNFTFLLKRSTFQMVIFQTVFFAVAAVIFKALIGFILAHLMHNIPSKTQRAYRALLLLPWVIPAAMSTLTWWWLFDPSYSAFNWALNVLGAPAVPWLGETWWARFSVILVNVWIGAPFFMIMYLAALKSVPEELYEAAAIDGASAWQKLVHITLPMMRNIIAITTLFSTIVTFANFDIVRVLTQGGPRNTTDLFGTWSFKLGIQGGGVPLGASVSLFMFPILAVLAYFILRNVRKRTTEI